MKAEGSAPMLVPWACIGGGCLGTFAPSGRALSQHTPPNSNAPEAEAEPAGAAHLGVRRPARVEPAHDAAHEVSAAAQQRGTAAAFARRSTARASQRRQAASGEGVDVDPHATHDRNGATGRLVVARSVFVFPGEIGDGRAVQRRRPQRWGRWGFLEERDSEVSSRPPTSPTCSSLQP
jgi:hypothetical protein